MAEGEIVNKVAQSPLITFNLEDYLPVKVEQLDIAQFLDGGYLLREKEFRASLQDCNYSPFVGATVRIHCSTDAILPAWASILVASKLSDHDIRSFWAPTEEAFFAQYYRWKLAQVNWSLFEGKPIIIKGCGDARIPQDAYIQTADALKGIAKKISYGEACSAVPLK